MAGNRHSDGVSSIVSAGDRSVIINECHDMMLALRTLRAAPFLQGVKVRDAPNLTRPLIGIENRTAQEVFDIMCDRILSAIEPAPSHRAQALEEIVAARKAKVDAVNVYNARVKALKEIGFGNGHCHDEYQAMCEAQPNFTKVAQSRSDEIISDALSSQPVADKEQEAAKTLLSGNMVKLYDACSGICKVHKFKAVLEKLASTSALPASPGASATRPTGGSDV